ncbi:MAG: TIGR02391 family protein, partial [Candidatus Binatota bacterium]
LSNDSDESEQRGMMYLYAGAMLAFRNPRAHGLISDEAEEALDIISFVSFLAKALDNAKK